MSTSYNLNFPDNQLTPFLKIRTYDDGKMIHTYNKKLLSGEHPNNMTMYRSVITNPDGKIISFSPPKMLHRDIFFENQHTSSYEITPFIEGTMVNMFYDDANNQWEMATKSVVYGNNKPDKNGPTFREMIDDINHYCNIQQMLDFIQSQIFQAFPDIQHTKLSFSFVMTTPLNPMVTFASSLPTLTLIDIYSIDGTTVTPLNNFAKTIFANCYPEQFNGVIHFIHQMAIHLPNCTSTYAYDKFTNLVASIQPSRSQIVGYVIKNVETDERTKWFTNFYLTCCKLRGNFSQHVDRCISLWKNDLMHEYFHYFPDMYTSLNHYCGCLHEIALQLLDLYKLVNITHEITLRDCDPLYKHHIYHLHGIYLARRIYKRTRIELIDVYNYLKTLQIDVLRELIYLIETQQEMEYT